MTHARALRLHAKAADMASLHPAVEAIILAAPGEGEVLVEVHAAGVNPSDVKAAMGFMPYAVFPRTPGRDFAGVVVAGPPDRVGQAVFGSSGDLGIRVNGTHATHLLVPAAAAVPQPAGITMEEAAGIGVPFVTAAEGFRRSGQPKPGDVVAVMGATGKVGQAAIQIATANGARAIAVVRRAEPYAGHASGDVTVIDASSTDVSAAIRVTTGGHGADIVFNTVGDPYYQAAHTAMALRGRHILIAAVDRIVQFNIFEFYRGQHSYYGIDTLALGSVDSAERLQDLLPGFASGALRPFPIQPHSRYSLSAAHQAYTAALGSSRERVILVPGLT